MKVLLDIGGDFAPCSQPPSGYMDWHAWAAVQHKAGLRQRECPTCGKWRYPQEMDGAGCATCKRQEGGETA